VVRRSAKRESSIHFLNPEPLDLGHDVPPLHLVCESPPSPQILALITEPPYKKEDPVLWRFLIHVESRIFLEV